VFALGAAPALLILVVRARPRPRSLAGAALCASLALEPWLAWSARHAESVFAPYARSSSDLIERLREGRYFTTSPATGRAVVTPASVRLRRFARLPYDLVFHSSLYEGNRDGYNGVFVLVALVGLFGWDARRLALFALAALPVVFAWSQMYLASVRYLFPLYPMYAVFASEGLRRWTARFSGRTGEAAGLALLACAAAFPVQFGSSGLEWEVAAGRMTPGRFLERKLPAYGLQRAVGPNDRVVLLGENDRFHCPAALAWRDDYLPISPWGMDPEAWRKGLSVLEITAILYREDRRSARPLLEALGDRLDLVARHGPAVLYRVRR